MNIYYFEGKQHFQDNIPLRALLYGEGVFETFRCINFKLPLYYHRHITRLVNGCKYLSIPLPGTDKITDFISGSLKSCQIPDAYVKLCIFSNGEAHYSSLPRSSNIILVLNEYPLIPDIVKIDISYSNRNSDSLLYHCKSLNYLENILLKRRAIDTGYYETLLLNEKGYIAECITHNIFWFYDGIIYTPSLDTGILSGITRSVLIDTLKSKGMTINEGHFTINALLSADFAFITNSISGIIQVSSICENNLDSYQSFYHDIKYRLLTSLKWI